jgi:hypothetical protein
MNLPAECAKRGIATQSDATPAQPEFQSPEATIATAPSTKSQTIIRVQPGQSPAAAQAEMVIAGAASNAVTATQFSKNTFGDVDLTACLTALNESIAAVHHGDLRQAEGTLMAQAIALNAVFTDLSQCSARALYRRLDTAERLMRLALRAQGQCRATLETLAVLKNPPTVFAKQANIAASAQQVTNTLSMARPASVEAGVRAYAGVHENGTTEILEAHEYQRLDAGTAETAGACDQTLAPVGPDDRPANGGREGALRAQP